MEALSIVKTDGMLSDAKRYTLNHPSKPSAFKLPVKIIGAIIAD
jgi:hypothetical protein